MKFPTLDKCPDCGAPDPDPIDNYIDNTRRGWLCYVCWNSNREKGFIVNPDAHHENMRKYGFKPGEK